MRAMAVMIGSKWEMALLGFLLGFQEATVTMARPGKSGMIMEIKVPHMDSEPEHYLQLPLLEALPRT